MVAPAPVVAEVGYLVGRPGGAKIEAAFPRSIVQETLTIAGRVAGSSALVYGIPPRAVAVAASIGFTGWVGRIVGVFGRSGIESG
jgi:hypothetical protein